MGGDDAATNHAREVLDMQKWSGREAPGPKSIRATYSARLAACMQWYCDHVGNGALTAPSNSSASRRDDRLAGRNHGGSSSRPVPESLQIVPGTH